jgi:hypothetical protein
MFKRRRFKQQISLQDRLNAWAGRLRAQADRLKPGPQKELLLQKAGQAETAIRLDAWINSSELKPPK